MKKRILAIILVSVMLMAALAACAGDPPAPPTPPASPSPAAPTPTPAPEDPPEEHVEDRRGEEGLGWNPLDYGGAFTRFDNNVHLTIGTFDRGRDDVPPIPDNFWTKWVQEHFGDNLNITVEYVPINRSDTMTAYNLLFAAQTPPTILSEFDYDKVAVWWDEGALIEIDRTQFQDIAPTWVETSGGFDKWDAFMFGGGTYLAPALRPFWDTNYNWVTFYRLDWYKEQGLGRPTSYEEWLAAQVIFKEAYDLPYTLDVSGFTNNFQFSDYNPFPLNEREWAMHANVSLPSLPAEGARRLLWQMNEQYQLGLINPEFELDEGGAAGVQTQALQAFVNGNLYRHSFFAQGYIPELAAFYENNPDAELGIMWNNTVNYNMGDQLGYRTHPQERATNPAGFFIGFSSSASEDEIKAAYMYLEWLAQPDVLDYFQWGEEGITFEYGDDGFKILNAQDNQGDMWMGHQGNKDYWALVVELRVQGDALTTATNVIPMGLPNSDQLRQEQADRYLYLRARADHGLTYNDPMIGAAIPAFAEYQGALVSLFQQMATQLVKADPTEFEDMYQQHVEAYRAAGFAEVEEQRGKAYDDGLVSGLPAVTRGDAPFSWWPIGSVTNNVYD